MFFLHWVRLAAVLTLLASAGCATTKVKPLGPVEPAIDPSQVAIYGKMPRHFRALALVEAHVYGAGFISDQKKTDIAVEALCDAAAKVGADGVLIRNMHPGAVNAFGYGQRAFRMGTVENNFAHMTAMHAVAMRVE
jgi:hypothetical protein